MSTHYGPVSTDIVLRLVAPSGPSREVRANLGYSPGDPYAVCVGFHAGTTEVVEWTFARSLLSEGVTHAVGDGDVRVWPADRTQSRVRLALSSPSGEAMFDAPTSRVLSFLNQTYLVVPTGCESSFVDVDAELMSLLDHGR
jgi:hypothetical protein